MNVLKRGVKIAVCFIRLVPASHFPKWGWLWAIAIAGIKGVSILAGYLMKKELVMLHTKANKLIIKRFNLFKYI